ncbi:MAG TPA: DUF2200 domain-containing protein [Acholeplasmatales bacterium]|nr:DUF2200 domain-containing protein [Acholeplasmatales bacterium]
MNYERLFKMSFSDLYPMYVAKATKKNRTQAEVDEIICWLTGYSKEELQTQISNRADLRTFFEQAPDFNSHASLITGVVCGVKVEGIEDSLMRKIRYLDKLIDELAKGRPLEKILRK